MISLFSKKSYLVDLLPGFIDIHNHILPGIDDGAQTVEESIALITGFAKFGVHHFIATPHIMYNYYDNTSQTIAGALQKLKNHPAVTADGPLSIQASAEHMIDSNFGSLLEAKGVMPLGKDHLLIEMSYLQPPINFDEAVKAAQNKWYFPVLAHPERYNFLHGRTKRYNEFKQRNILFQMNMLSLGDYYGKEVFKTAIKLLEEGMIDFLGSDVHHQDHLAALEKITITKKTKGLLLPIIAKTIETFK